MDTRTGIITATTVPALVAVTLAAAPASSVTAPAVRLAAVSAPAAPAPPAAPAAVKKTDYRSVIATLKRELPDLMAAGKAVGLSIALVDGRRTVWQGGFGLANRERGRKVTPKTLFHIGSTSKTMTALAVMQLVERGKVDLDAPLTRYVPEFKMRKRFKHDSVPERSRGVTVRSIMTHHSGIPGDMMNLDEFGKKPSRTFYRDAVKQLRKSLPTRRVGAAWAYSNMAINLLRGVVENVSGLSLEQYTRRHIFKPLGMTATSFDDSRQSGRRVAAPYQVLMTPDGQVGDVIRRAREYINIRPAGSVYSNADDMVRYLKAMIGSGKAPGSKRVLRRSTVKQMITPQPASPWDRLFWKQGLVWWIGYGNQWPTVVNHGGDTYFHHTMAAWLPKQKLGVFVSVNTLNYTNVTKSTWQRALGLMLQAKTGRTPPVPAPPKPVGTPDRAELQAAKGRYVNSGGVVDVTVAGDALQITSRVQSPDAQTLAFTRRTDGWYAADVAAAPQFRPARIRGQGVLLTRSPGGEQGLYAQRLPRDYRVPSAWRSRVGTYAVRGVSPNAYPKDLGAPMVAMLSMYDGVLLLNHAQVLLPASAKLAFTYGPSPLQGMRDEGNALEVRNGKLWFMGARLVRLPDSAGVTAQRTPPVHPWASPLAPATFG